MSKTPIIAFGKSARVFARLRGGGSALPGLLIEKLDPHFLKHTLSQLPHGVVIISGTNGKTTTTKMVAALLKSQGLNVFTNSTGSNFKRGVISALIEKISLNGTLGYDIAVLELDEAHAVQFVQEVKPDYSLLLNVMRDQLDRFGEIDTTTTMLEAVAHATIKGVVLNAEDRRVREIARSLDKNKLRFFGLSAKTRTHFPGDDELYGANPLASLVRPQADVVLEDFSEQKATFRLEQKNFTTTLRLSGIYNIYNAAAALALTQLICGEKFELTQAIQTLATVEPAFGRGEKIIIGDQPLELVLVKNPSGFRLALGSFSPENIATMIAINDNYADGRDMSWLWDVDFSSLQQEGVATVSGIRAYDMALRLQYDDVKTKLIEMNLAVALKHFLDNNAGPKRIFCTYTAMLDLRKNLKKYIKMERVL